MLKYDEHAAMVGRLVTKVYKKLVASIHLAQRCHSFALLSDVDGPDEAPGRAPSGGRGRVRESAGGKPRRPLCCSIWWLSELVVG